jgi:hypothetical protein
LDPCGDAKGNNLIREILYDNGACSNDRVRSNVGTLEYYRSKAQVGEGA